jgi:CubicO group peptidase (beta-lactamase class C family)
MFGQLLAILFVMALCTSASNAQSPIATAIDAYLQPYAASGNFAGAVLVEKSGKLIFERAYGLADREHRVSNTSDTRFHVASVSMQFTAASILQLVDKGSLSLDEHITDLVPELEGADKITIRDLLTERSGLPDINALPNYDDLLQRHQTPSTLVAAIEGKPLLFEPGSKFLHEEHSAYNVLALIVEKRTGVPFAAAVENLVFQPIGLKASGVDDDSVSDAGQMAKGYAPDGLYGLKPVNAIHWSGKTGNASVYTTVNDERRWVDALFSGHVLSAESRDAVLDTSTPVGYGWFKGKIKRFGNVGYYMNGRAPGFSSFVFHLPDRELTVIVLGNIYCSATTPMGYDIAALSLGLPYEKLHFADRAPSRAELQTCAGTFQFGPDFYQPNARVTLIANGPELWLRWPSGDVSALLPLERDHYIDRSYWEEVRIERDSSGKPTALVYDHFHGTASRPQ